MSLNEVERQKFRVTANESFLKNSKISDEIKLVFDKPRLNLHGETVKNFVVAEFDEKDPAVEIYIHLRERDVPVMRNWID